VANRVGQAGGAVGLSMEGLPTLPRRLREPDLGPLGLYSRGGSDKSHAPLTHTVYKVTDVTPSPI
jgi:hypothetical protein